MPEGQSGFEAKLAPEVRRAILDLRREAASTAATIAAAIDLVYPIGKMTVWPGSVAPTNHAICDGAAVSRTTYAALFDEIGTTHGVGDGSTTFNLPDTRGRVVVGVAAADAEFNVLGETGGAKTHTLTIAEMPAHHHVQQLGGALTTAAPAAGAGVIGQANNGDTADTGGGDPHNNLQPYIALNYIIRLA